MQKKFANNFLPIMRQKQLLLGNTNKKKTHRKHIQFKQRMKNPTEIITVIVSKIHLSGADQVSDIASI